MKSYEFIYKSLFFPKKGILAIGDLHLGFELILKKSGILLPGNQISKVISDLKEIFNEIKKRGYNIKKIIFLGDIKHSFCPSYQDKDELNKIMNFLKKYLDEKDIIFIKGNHDTYKNFEEIIPKHSHTEEETIFIHGHKPDSEILEKEIKIIIIGHLHPSILLTKNPGVNMEFYKCFLEGKYQEKTFIVIPSFFDIIEGTLINDYEEDYIESFSIIPKKDIMESKIHVISGDDVYEFGRIDEL